MPHKSIEFFLIESYFFTNFFFTSYPLFPYNHPEQRQTYFSTGCNSILNIVQSFKL